VNFSMKAADNCKTFRNPAMADRLVEAIVSDQISPEDKAFIEEQNMFFLATVDREGRPNCSYKGGSVGLVKVIDEHTLAFPLYDGSGMYLSAAMYWLTRMSPVVR